jgi:hypothetical protein
LATYQLLEGPNATRWNRPARLSSGTPKWGWLGGGSFGGAGPASALAMGRKRRESVPSWKSTFLCVSRCDCVTRLLPHRAARDPTRPPGPCRRAHSN